MSAADRNHPTEGDADVLVVAPPAQDDTTALLFDDGTLLEQLFCEWAAGSDDLEDLCRSVQSATPTPPSPPSPLPAPSSLPAPSPLPPPPPSLATQTLTPPSSPSAPREQSPSTPPPVLLLTPPSTPPKTTAPPASYEDLLCTESMPASPRLRTFPRFRGAASLQPPQPRYRACPYPEHRPHHRPTRAAHPTMPQTSATHEPTVRPPVHKPPTVPTPPPEEEPTTRVWLVKRTTTRRIVTYRRCADDTVLVTSHPTASVVHYAKVVSHRPDK